MNPSQVTTWNFNLELKTYNFITKDLLVRYKPTNLEAEVCNFIFHVYTQSFAAYKINPKRLINDLILHAHY